MDNNDSLMAARMRITASSPIRHFLFACCALAFACVARAGDELPELPELGGGAPYPHTGYVYSRPSAFGWMTRAPQNLWRFGQEIVNPENRWSLLGLAAGTAVLIRYDQPILDASQRFAKRIGLIKPPEVNGREIYYLYKTDVEGIDLPIYVPANLNSAMYYLGDGYTQLMIVGGFFGYGMFAGNNRALQTASLTVESLFTTGIVIQILKRTTGRESPFTASEPGGRWDFFPNQKQYNYRTPNYDAFPSGHIATVMAATTVISENYPEYGWIKPVGYTAMALLGFAMLNNGVHWASEYPIGIAIGYTAAKISMERVPRALDASKSAHITRNSWYAWPSVYEKGGGLSFGWRF